MVAAAAAHEIRSGATAIESHSPSSPQGFPWRQEVTALEADDFLWDRHASGLCWLQQQPEQTRTNKSLSHIVKSCTQQCSTFVILSCGVCVFVHSCMCALVCFYMEVHACICISTCNVCSVYLNVYASSFPSLSYGLAGHLFPKGSFNTSSGWFWQQASDHWMIMEDSEG